MATALEVGLEEARPETLVMLDPNCRPPAIFYRRAHLARFIRLMPRVDVVKASRDDLEFLWPDMPTADAALLILAAGPAAVVVTDGPRSVECFTKGWTLEFAVPMIDAVDSIGAGDAFGGAFLARWIERGHGRPALSDRSAMRDAIGVAIDVASMTCRRSGAHPPRRHEIAWPV
jgi:fructokinase